MSINLEDLTACDHALCLHASLHQTPAIHAFQENAHPRGYLIDGPQLPIMTDLRAHVPIPMISTVIRVEGGNTRANLQAAPRRFGMDQEEAGLFQEEEVS